MLPQVLPRMPKAISKLSGCRFKTKNWPPSARQTITVAIQVLRILKGEQLLTPENRVGTEAQASSKKPSATNGMAVRKLKYVLLQFLSHKGK